MSVGVSDVTFSLEGLEPRILFSTTLYWDTNGATPGLGGSGTWDATAANWTTDATGSSPTQAWVDGGNAVFSGAAGAVAVSGTVSAGLITFGVNGYSIQNGTIDLASGTHINVGTWDATIGSILASNGFAKYGTGTLTLTGSDSNTYSGITALIEGTLVLSKETGAIAIPGNLWIEGTSVVRLGGDEQIGDSSQLNISGALELAGHVETVGWINNYGTIENDSATPGQITFSGIGATGAIQDGSDSAPLSVVKVSNWSSMLGPDMSYTGDTTVLAGELSLQDTTNFVSNIHNYGDVDFDYSVDGTYGGTIDGPGGVKKNGAGTLTLTGMNSYSGGTWVLAGTLIVDGGIGSATVSSGATLGGAGLMGPVVVNQGGYWISPPSVLQVQVPATVSRGFSSTLTGTFGGGTSLAHTVTIDWGDRNVCPRLLS